jgi:hypothetical protein
MFEPCNDLFDRIESETVGGSMCRCAPAAWMASREDLVTAEIGVRH